MLFRHLHFCIVAQKNANKKEIMSDGVTAGAHSTPCDAQELRAELRQPAIFSGARVLGRSAEGGLRPSRPDRLYFRMQRDFIPGRRRSRLGRRAAERGGAAVALRMPGALQDMPVDPGCASDGYVLGTPA